MMDIERQPLRVWTLLESVEPTFPGSRIGPGTLVVIIEGPFRGLVGHVIETGPGFTVTVEEK